MEEVDESYFVSMVDIMVGLLFIFILIVMYFAFQLKAQTEAQENYAQTAADHRSKILIEIKEHLEKEGVLNVRIDTEQGILRLPEGVLFASGVAEISSGSSADVVSGKLAAAFNDVLRCSVFNDKKRPFDVSINCQNKNPEHVFLESILIEGHTDNVPINETGLRTDSRINSNLRLSARRATNTFERLIIAAPTLSEFKSPKNETMLAVSAYGETRPIENNDTVTGRRNNRRIDIRLLMYVPGTSQALIEYRKRITEFL